MTDKYELKLKKAVSKLSLLNSIKITKKATSHYQLGVEPAIEDRLDICIADKINCQVLFDSSNYDFPPDIIFKNCSIHQQLMVDDIGSLLPDNEWSIDNEDCLYEWFERILTTVKQTKPSHTLDKRLSQKRSMPDKEEANDGKKRARLLELSDHEEDVFQEASKEPHFPLFNKNIKKAPNNRLLRKECMTAFLNRYSSQIMQYDAKEYTYFTLYMNFEIAQDTALWTRYQQTKQSDLKAFNLSHKNKEKIPRPKPFAPMIVKFSMSKDFPKHGIEVKLISVLNTRDVGSSDPETKDLNYPVKSTDGFKLLVDDVISDLSDKAIRFHLLQP